MAEIDRPAGLLMITESNNGSGAVAWCGYWNRETDTQDPTYYNNAGRHNEGNNVGFVDGHAKWLKASVVRQTRGYWDSRYSQ